MNYMKFSQALEYMDCGDKLYRASWAAGTWVKMTYQPTSILLHSATGTERPWAPTLEDVVAEDWEEWEEPK